MQIPYYLIIAHYAYLIIAHYNNYHYIENEILLLSKALLMTRVFDLARCFILRLKFRNKANIQLFIERKNAVSANPN